MEPSEALKDSKHDSDRDSLPSLNCVSGEKDGETWMDAKREASRIIEVLGNKPTELTPAVIEAEAKTLLQVTSLLSGRENDSVDNIDDCESHDSKAMYRAMSSLDDATRSDLHKAFLYVAMSCLRHQGSHGETVFALVRRAYKLELTFHTSFLEKLAKVVAETQPDSVSKTVLEIASFAAPKTIEESPSFFCDALVALVARGLLRDALDLRAAVKDRYNMEIIDKRTASYMADWLKEGMEASDDLDAARQLVSLLDETLTKKDVQDRAKRYLSGEELVEKLVESFDDDYDDDTDYDVDFDIGAEDDIDDFSDDDSDDDDDDYDVDDERNVVKDTEPVDDLAGLAAIVNSSDEEFEKWWNRWKPLFLSQLPEGIKPGNDKLIVALQVNKKTGKIERMEIDPPEMRLADRKRDAARKQMLYIRDASKWVLPDVTAQFHHLSPDLRYSDDFEEELLDSLRDEDDSNDNDNNSIYEEDDDDDDDENERDE